MQRVAINGRFLAQPTTGVQRFARETTRALDELLGGDPAMARRWAVEVVAPPDATLDLSLRRVAVRRTAGRLRGHAWEQLVLPYAARGAVLVSFANTSPLAVARQLVVMHDAAVWAVPHAYSWAFRTWYRALLPRVGRRAQRVGTVSAFSREELASRAGIPRTRVTLLSAGAEHVIGVPPDDRIFGRTGLDPGRYVLAVAGASAHKNLAAVAAAAAVPVLAGLAVAVVGGAQPRVFGAGTPAPDDPLRRLGRVTDGELRALYEGAVCLVFPSSYEGFGLPPLEAMACGCPVVVSRAGALPEVCGAAALYCDPCDASSIAAHVRALATRPALRADMVRRGRARAAEFTWPATAHAVIAALSDMAA